MSNMNVVKEAYAAFGRGDVAAVTGAMDREIQWSEAEDNPYMPTGRPWSGPDVVLNNLFVRLATEWDAFTVHPKTFHDAGDSIIVEGRYTGTHKETGRHLDSQFCHIWWVRNARLARFQQYADTAQLQDVMGARREA